MDSRPAGLSVKTAPRELGDIHDLLLICGGAYSNLEALSALLETAARLSIPPERIVHTGDAVAYCGDPLETARLLRGSGAHAIQGNVEESLWASSPDCGCGFEEGSECERLSAAWFAHADARIDTETRRWMGGLPFQLNFTMSGRRVRVLHGGVASINRFIFASMPERIFMEEFERAGADVIIGGHSGIPFTREAGGRVWHNSGALGMPANDGTPRAWYSLMIPEGNDIRFEHHALDYDHEAARKKMLAAGLPGGYADALATGLWPGLDVLPAAEKARAGQPLNAKTLGASVRCTAHATG